MPGCQHRSRSIRSYSLRIRRPTSSKVACSQRSHGHSEVGEHLVDGGNRGTSSDKELSLAAVWMKHAITYKAPAVANQHADFPKSL
jgi:hypothetical protein